MWREILRHFQNSGARGHRRHVLIRVLACVVVFCTAYSLILPAITMERAAAEENGIYLEESVGAEIPETETTEEDTEMEAAESAYFESITPTEETSESEDAAENIRQEDAAETSESEDISEESETSGDPLVFENDTIKVTATPQGTEIPTGAILVVTQIIPGMEAYDAYFAALNRGFEDNPYNGENSLLYDISVIADGQEYEPETGSLGIELEFKDNQLSGMLGMAPDEEDAPLRVIHLPVTGEDTTGSLENVDQEWIEKEYVQETIVESDGTETIRFSLDSLSVITVTGASTNVTVTGALQGTTMKSLNYNLYAYLVSETGGDAYGVKVNFENGQFSGTISGVPVGRYKLVLAYKPNNQALQEGKWNKNNVEECTVIENSGQYVFGYTSVMPADKTVSASDNTVGFALQVSEVQTNVSIASIMDRAINYGITAESLSLPNNCYTNFATKSLNIKNQNSQTYYGHRSDGIDVVPNIAADVTNDGQPLTTENNQAANYYVTDEDKGKVNSSNQEETIVRNKNELEDRVEIMISNTLKQAEELAQQSSVILPAGLISVDVSPYGENATIVIDATNISGEQNGFTIVKRPGQTVVFNINGENAAPPQNIKIKLVDDNGDQIGSTYVAGDDMRNAPASDGNVWNKIIWNFPEASSVTATNQIGGIFLVPHGDFHADNKGGGWIVARGSVSVTNEWYAFPGSDEPFKQKIIRKTFVGIDADHIDPDYALKLWTHTNESTSGTTDDQLITTLVLKPDTDTSLITDPTGVNDQTGYMTTGIDADGNVFYEWKTPSISVGNEHKLTEIHSDSTDSEHLDLIEFTAPFSGWNESAQDYTWWQKEETFTSEQEFEGIFNVSSHNDDYRQYVYVANHYNVEKNPHQLTLTKLVTDPEGLEEDGQRYTFLITLRDENGELIEGQAIRYTIDGGEQQSQTSRQGILTIRLQAGQTVMIPDLPYGTQYTIEELELPQKCEVSFGGDTTGVEKAVGKLIKDRAVTATNTYSDDPGVPITAHKDLVNGILEEGQFTYKLVDQNGKLVRQAVNDANGNIAFGTLIFDQDGEYDYRLYEVADLSMKDIVFDTRVYAVHLVVQGGRVRQVTYNGGSTTPMFRNEKINPSSDKLTARKLFVDAEGKAIELEGDEFTFTATADDGTVYTGKNDANGMVTFRDATGNVIDLDDLTGTTTFIIAETNGSYTGEVPEGQTLTYDENTYEATATVSTRTVTVTPVSIVADGKDNATVSVTFTPEKTGEKYYFTIPNGGASTVVPREDGSVTMSIPISKNQTRTDGNYRDIPVEYGIGEYYNTHESLGTIVIRAKGGNWGQGEIEVDSVKVNGEELSSSTRTEKTVTLSYADGSYPVFENVLSKEEPDTVDFVFTKEWHDTSDQAISEWPEGVAIHVKVQRRIGTEGDAEEVGSYEIKKIQSGFDITKTSDAPALLNTDGFSFALSELPASGTIGNNTGEYTYFVTETEAVSGYRNAVYSNPSISAPISWTISEDGALDGGKIINKPQESYELPTTGGPGTTFTCLLGSVLLLLAGAALLMRRRRMIHGQK